MALGVGIVGSGNAHTAAELAGLARRLGVGEPRVYADPAEMVRDPAVDAVWVCSPNFLRIGQVGAITGEVTAGRAELVGLACEKPLARNLREAREVVRLVEQAGGLPRL